MKLLSKCFLNCLQKYNSIGVDYNITNIPDTGGISLSEYRLVRKRLFIKVDFPRPDSPGELKMLNLYIELKYIFNILQP